jgi:hypothetical protein
MKRKQPLTSPDDHQNALGTTPETESAEAVIPTASFDQTPDGLSRMKKLQNPARFGKAKFAFRLYQR